jgi:5-methyltetrahydrofolate corrinoid/iron sulfur protein methyltransferase
MILIGERINGGFQDIKAAVEDHDKGPIQRWAKLQAEAGADYVDINIGAVSSKVDDFVWMVDAVQEVVDIGISIDSNKPRFVVEALKVCKNKAIINSTTADPEKMDEIIPLAAEYGAGLVGLCMDKSGAPRDIDRRVELGAMIFTEALEKGVAEDRIFLDPITMPVKFLQEEAGNFLGAVQQLTLLSSPPPHIICGLSNIASKTKNPGIINTVFLVMAMSRGLDAAICDVTDKQLVDAAITAELLLNKQIYSDSYIKAYREGRKR